MNRLRISRIAVLVGLVVCMAGTAAAYTRRFDANGDGRSDIVWVNSVTGEKLLWIMNGGQILGGGLIHPDPNWQITHYGDFNGDGMSDLVWHYGPTGEAAMWLMNGSTYASANRIASHPLVVVGVADFNGIADNPPSLPLMDDLILVDKYWVSGSYEIWVMNGTRKIRSATHNRGTNYSVKHFGRFRIDLNQEDDMIWYNQVSPAHHGNLVHERLHAWAE